MIELIEREKETYRIYAIIYSARGEPTRFEVNPHRSIPYQFIRDGLQVALDGILNELDENRKAIKKLFEEGNK